MDARMAKTSVWITNLNWTCRTAGFSAIVSSAALQAQENFVRLSTVDSPGAVSPPVLRQSSGPDEKQKDEKAKADLNVQKDTASEKASDSKDDASARSKEQTKLKNREPLILPSLTIPNTSIEGLGTGATPEDKVSGRLPAIISLPYGPERYGFWALENKTWTAPVFCHQPLYFEDTMLERHGHERFPCLQPLMSGTRFFSDVALLPYHSCIQRPFEERYNTGHYRPGSPAPGLRQRLPYDAGALRFQLLTTGAAVLIAQP